MKALAFGIESLGIRHTSAGWVVYRYDLEDARPNFDVLAGAFPTVEEAIDAAKRVVNTELDGIRDAAAMRVLSDLKVE